jgi:hypothetical protein
MSSGLSEVFRPERKPAPFIVGAARSGTTLLRLMLDAHPQLAIPSETHFVPALLAFSEEAGDPRERFLHEIISHPLWPDFRLDPSAFRQRVKGLPTFSPGDGLRVFYTLYAERFGKSRWGDKTPLYILQMRAIQEALPEAAFVHLIRDGRDVLASIKGLWFRPGSAADTARWWTGRIRAAREQAAHLHSYLEVRYEDLLTATETVLRQVCAFLDLPWDEAMLRYYERATLRLAEAAGPIPAPHHTTFGTGTNRSRIHGLTSTPPARDRIGRWKRELAGSEGDEFEEIARPTLRELGYEVG